MWTGSAGICLCLWCSRCFCHTRRYQFIWLNKNIVLLQPVTLHFTLMLNMLVFNWCGRWFIQEVRWCLLTAFIILLNSTSLLYGDRQQINKINNTSNVHINHLHSHTASGFYPIKNAINVHNIKKTRTLFLKWKSGVWWSKTHVVTHLQLLNAEQVPGRK